MRHINRKPLNLNRETLQTLSNDTLEHVAGGDGVTDVTKYTKYTGQLIDTARKVTQYIPTRNCSIGQACAR
jgi:hypothetical protein